MPLKRVFLSVDLGASSGRVMAALWDGNDIELREIHRFKTPSAYVIPYHYWDILQIYTEILNGLRKAAQMFGDQIASLAVDTWGVDYGLLDSAGELLSNPIQYRDSRTREIVATLPDEIGREKIYAETGIQIIIINTIYQLASARKCNRSVFNIASKLLFLPDLINYWLTGRMIQERTIASTSQLLNPHTGKWSEVLIEEIGLPGCLFGEITEPGTPLGNLQSHLAEDLGMPKVNVIAAPGHDTACAVAATPFKTPNSAFLSSGTWSILGIETDTPNTTLEALEAGFSNEIGYNKSIRFLKNTCGMWLIEESRRHWAKDGEEYSYAAIVELARKAQARKAFIDPDAPELSAPGDIPSRIAEHCRKHNHPAPENQGEVLRVAYDSLAMNYRYVFRKLQGILNKSIDSVHIVGGGAHNDFLNQMTADAIGVPVLAGPIEATSLGNISVQMIASEEISNLTEAREVIKRSFPPKIYEPTQSDVWITDAERFRKVTA